MKQEKLGGPIEYGKFVILIIILVLVANLIGKQTGATTGDGRIMELSMGLFFGTFGLLKVLKLKDFALAFQGYDLIAGRLPIYGYLYPLIELALCAMFLASWQIVPASIITIIVMTVSVLSTGYILYIKKRIPCACAGLFIKLPLSKVTLLEDTAMIAMAITLLTKYM